MINLDKSAREGHYAKKQILSKDWLISWSHCQRFEVGLRLVRQLSPRRILDYGCGDGTFLAIVTADSSPPFVAIGSEVHPSLVEDCRTRLGNRRRLSFILCDDLDAPEHDRTYDLVICMEVLEHLLDVEPVLNRFLHLLAPSGRLLISVPVETGLPLIVRQAVRSFAAWRGVGDYPGTSSYTLSEYWASMFVGRLQHISRPIHQAEDGRYFHDRKSLNWLVLGDALTHRFHIEKTVASPVTWLSPHLASQVWFLARRKI